MPSGWTNPFFLKDTLRDEEISDSKRWVREILAWSLMETMEGMIAEGNAPTDLRDWVGRWERDWPDQAEWCMDTDAGLAHWLASDFSQRTDYWRTRVGWYPGINVRLEFDWEFPSNQSGLTYARITHPEDQGRYIETYFKQGATDPSELIVMYWMKRRWERFGREEYGPLFDDVDF
jgi:hypothetical protein